MMLLQSRVWVGWSVGMVFFIPVRGGLTGVFSIMWVLSFSLHVFLLLVRGGITGDFSNTLGFLLRCRCNVCSGSVLFHFSGILYGCSSSSRRVLVLVVLLVFFHQRNLSANTVRCMLDLLHFMYIIGIFDA